MQFLDLQSKRSDYNPNRRPDPTPEEIRDRCLEFQKMWSEEERIRRMTYVPCVATTIVQKKNRENR